MSSVYAEQKLLARIAYGLHLTTHAYGNDSVIRLSGVTRQMTSTPLDVRLCLNKTPIECGSFIVTLA